MAPAGRPAMAIGWIDPPSTSGSALTVPAASTPGRTRTRSSTRSKKALCSRGWGYFACGTASERVKTPWGSRPGSMLRRAPRLLMVSAAPSRRTSDRATSATTRALRVRRPPAAASVRLKPCLSPRIKSFEKSDQAGTSPAASPVKSEIPTVEIVGRRDRERLEPREARGRRHVEDPHQPSGLCERHRPQQHGVDDAEDGGVRADPQGQDADRGGGEARALAEGTETVTEILRHRSHDLSTRQQDNAPPGASRGLPPSTSRYARGGGKVSAAGLPEPTLPAIGSARPNPRTRNETQTEA